MFLFCQSGTIMLIYVCECFLISLMFPYSVLYWFGLSIGPCLFWPVSVWLSNSPGNYSILIFCKFMSYLCFPFLKVLLFCLLTVVHGLGGIPMLLVVPSQVLLYMFSFRALFLTHFHCVTDTTWSLHITLLVTCQSLIRIILWGLFTVLVTLAYWWQPSYFWN